MYYFLEHVAFDFFDFFFSVSLSLSLSLRKCLEMLESAVSFCTLVAAFITSRLGGVLLKVRCKSSSEVGGLRVVKKADVSDDQKWAVFVMPNGRCK